MQIDWFTLSAQIVNFLILLFLLKKLLFDRIVSAMDQREEKIASRIEQAEQDKQDAADKKNAYEKKMDEWEQRRKEMMEEARDDAEKEKKKLRESARKEIESMRDEWRQSLDNEKKKFIKDLRLKTGRQIYEISKKLVKDMADKEMEQEMIHVFLERVKNLSEKEKKNISNALNNNNNKASIISAFEMDSSQKSNLTRSLNDEFDKKIDVDYKQSDELICGIELEAGNRLVSWSAEKYLDQMEERMMAYISENENGKS